MIHHVQRRILLLLYVVSFFCIQGCMAGPFVLNSFRTAGRFVWHFGEFSWAAGRIAFRTAILPCRVRFLRRLVPHCYLLPDYDDDDFDDYLVPSNVTTDDLTMTFLESRCPNKIFGSGNGQDGDNEDRGTSGTGFIDDVSEDVGARLSLDWLPFVGNAEEREYRQLYALTKFYYATRSDYSSSRNRPLDRGDWLRNCDVCSWDGVSCVLNHVVELHLPQQDLQEDRLGGNRGILGGTLPAEMSDLSSLTGLNLNGNSISGQLPEGVGTFLFFLDLSHNRFMGTIPISWAGRLLLRMDLSDNDLSGPITDEFVNELRRIQTLDLSNNNINGTFPQFAFDNLIDLSRLNLQGNDIVGTVPPLLCDTMSFTEFTTDCLDSTKVDCGCCTECF